VGTQRSNVEAGLGGVVIRDHGTSTFSCTGRWSCSRTGHVPIQVQLVRVFVSRPAVPRGLRRVQLLRVPVGAAAARRPLRRGALIIGAAWSGGFGGRHRLVRQLPLVSIACTISNPPQVDD